MLIKAAIIMSLKQKIEIMTDGNISLRNLNISFANVSTQKLKNIVNKAKFVNSKSNFIIVIKSAVLSEENNERCRAIAMVSDTDLKILSDTPITLINSNRATAPAFGNRNYKTVRFENVETDNLKDISELFRASSSEEIMLDTLDTSNIKTMSWSFSSCQTKKLDLSKCNFKSLENIDNIFTNCNIDELNLDNKYFIELCKNITPYTRVFDSCIANNLIVDYDDWYRNYKVYDTRHRTQIKSGITLYEAVLSLIDAYNEEYKH